MDSIVSYLIPISKKRSARSVAKLVFAASCYFIWQERNFRLFKNQKRSHAQIVDMIRYTARLKLLMCKFKRSNNGQAFASLEVTGLAHPNISLMDCCFVED